MGAYGGTKAELIKVLKLVRADRLKSVISRVVPLSKVSEAHKDMEDGKVTGKVVVSIAE